MEIKKQIAKLRARLKRLNELLKAGDSGEPMGIRQRKDVIEEMKQVQAQLDKLLAENPHDDGTGRKPTSYNMMKDPKK